MSWIEFIPLLCRIPSWKPVPCPGCRGCTFTKVCLRHPYSDGCLSIVCQCTLCFLSSHSSRGLSEVPWPSLGNDGPQRSEGHQPVHHTNADRSWWSKPLWVTSHFFYHYLNFFFFFGLLIPFPPMLKFIYVFVCAIRVCVVMRCLPECVPVSWSKARGDLSMCHLARGLDGGHSQVQYDNLLPHAKKGKDI